MLLAMLLAAMLAAMLAAAPAATKPRDPAVESRALAVEIAQRKDSARRAAGVARAIDLLGGDDARGQLIAMSTLRSVADVKFDRAPIAGPLRRLLASSNEEVRATAVALLPSQGGGPRDLDAIVALADDPAPRVRAAVPAAFVGANENNGGGTFDALTLKLLDDADPNVRREALRATQNLAVAEAVEARMIALSRDAKLGRDAIVLGLATRPFVRRPVADRLIETLDDAGDNGLIDRCAWGLRNDVAPDARAAVDAALLRALDDSVDTTVRVNCINSLAKSNDPAVGARIESIAGDADEVDRVRDAARRVATAGH